MHSCLELLVQSKDSMVRNNEMRREIISYLFFVVKKMIDVLELFYIEKKYTNFDPHVGDTACQIRACYIAQLATHPKDKHTILLRIKELNFLSQQLMSSEVTSSPGKNNEYTIHELIEKLKLHFYISVEEKILFQSYFLTLFKKETSSNIYIDFDAISTTLNVSRKFSKKLARHYQLSIAEFSCALIMKWTLLFPESVNLDLMKSLLRFDDDERPVLPCYLYTKVLFLYAHRCELPLLVLSKTKDSITPLLFQASETKGYTVVPINLSNELNKPCIVISGNSTMNEDCFISEFINIGIKSILLSAMAAHIQYSGKRLLEYNDVFKDIKKNTLSDESAEELNSMRDLARSIGCCYEHPSLFVVKHIFCSTLKSELLQWNTHLPIQHDSFRDIGQEPALMSQ